mmetsp:Transcript_131876/g.299820  ORF Transcript_131876/g.299820 Transcript_131876/m.299820 type:complete len:214 (-) Transcript_131876:86-727(-)
MWLLRHSRRAKGKLPLQCQHQPATVKDLLQLLLQMRNTGGQQIHQHHRLTIDMADPLDPLQLEKRPLPHLHGDRTRSSSVSSTFTYSSVQLDPEQLHVHTSVPHDTPRSEQGCAFAASQVAQTDLLAGSVLEEQLHRIFEGFIVLPCPEWGNAPSGPIESKALGRGLRGRVFRHLPNHSKCLRIQSLTIPQIRLRLVHLGRWSDRSLGSPLQF